MCVRTARLSAYGGGVSSKPGAPTPRVEGYGGDGAYRAETPDEEDDDEDDGKVGNVVKEVYSRSRRRVRRDLHLAIPGSSAELAYRVKLNFREGKYIVERVRMEMEK